MSDIDLLDEEDYLPDELLDDDILMVSKDIADSFFKNLNDRFEDLESTSVSGDTNITDTVSANDDNEITTITDDDAHTSDIIDDILLMDEGSIFNASKVLKESADPNLSQCPYCKKEYTSKDWLDTHINECHKGYKPLRPRLVVQKDYSSLIYDDTKYQTELQQKILDTYVKPFVCCICQLRFETSELLDSHKQQHVKVNAFECKTCAVSFKVAWQLSMHLFNHKKNVFVCKQCNKKFTTAESLKEHAKEHKTDFFICEKCGTTFNNIIKLKDHAKEHSMVHKCHICSQIFTTIYNLQEHIINHNKKEIFKCTKCPKRYTDFEKMKLHVQFHEEKVGVFCYICQKWFKTLSLLKRHLKVHDVQEEKKCKICGKTFTRINNLSQHLAAHARKEKYMLVNL